MKDDMRERDWVIGIAGSGMNGVDLYKFTGTEQQTKKQLARLIAKDREADPEGYLDGTMGVIGLISNKDTLSGWAHFDGYNIEYTAIPFDRMRTLVKQKGEI